MGIQAAVIKEDKGDAGAGSETRYTIALGDIFQGTLDPAGDGDWIKVELGAETIYDFTLSGVDAAELALFDSDGNRIVRGGATSSGVNIPPDYLIRCANDALLPTGFRPAPEW